MSKRKTGLTGEYPAPFVFVPDSAVGTHIINTAGGSLQARTRHGPAQQGTEADQLLVAGKIVRTGMLAEVADAPKKVTGSQPALQAHTPRHRPSTADDPEDEVVQPRDMFCFRGPAKRPKLATRAQQQKKEDKEEAADELSDDDQDTGRGQDQTAPDGTASMGHDVGGVQQFFAEQTREGARATSDNTLSRLPRLDAKTFQTISASLPGRYTEDIEGLVASYDRYHSRWLAELSNQFSLLLHGLGSKKEVASRFAQAMLGKWPIVYVNGYSPALSLQQVMSTIGQELFGYSGTFRNPLDQLKVLRSLFDAAEGQEEAGRRRLYLFVHNIDGPSLRPRRTQAILSMLAAFPQIHLIATIDHINATLLWDAETYSRFRWVSYNTTTFSPYKHETEYEDSQLAAGAEGGWVRAMVVLRSLNPTARAIFHVLAVHQADATGTDYQGMSEREYFSECRDRFLVNNMVTFRTQTTQFVDHHLMLVRKGADGQDHYVLGLDKVTVGQVRTQLEKELDA